MIKVSRKEELGPQLERRMGHAAPVQARVDITVPPGVLDQGSVDFAGFGKSGPQGAPVVTEEAKTPAVRPFPAQGESVRQDGDYHVFIGFGGVPFRSKGRIAPDIKAGDPLQPVITADVQVKIFDLSDPTDLKLYASVWDNATKGFFVAPVEERQWIAETKNWKVFMRWGVKYWELPQ